MSRSTTERDEGEAAPLLLSPDRRPAESDTEGRQPGVTPTEILLLDLLENGPLDRETLFTRAEPAIWGHHVTLAAVEAGRQAGDDYQLMVLGKRPAFDRALDSLIKQRFVRRAKGGLVTLKGAGRGTVVDADGELVPYVPGTQARQTKRWQVETAAREMERAHPEVVEKLSPPMSESEFALLVESMRSEGFDPLLPIIIDSDTGKVVDGYQRLAAANAAAVKPRFRSVRFESSAERLRFVARANRHRRNLSPRQEAQFDKALSQLGVSMHDVADISVRPTTNAHGANALGSNRFQPGAGKTEVGEPGVKISSRAHGMTVQTRQQVVEILGGIREQNPRSVREARVARRKVARKVAAQFDKAVGTIMDPLVRKAGHSRADEFDRLALEWLEGDGSSLLASILGTDPARWNEEDAEALQRLLSESGQRPAAPPA